MAKKKSKPKLKKTIKYSLIVIVVAIVACLVYALTRSKDGTVVLESSEGEVTGTSSVATGERADMSVYGTYDSSVLYNIYEYTPTQLATDISNGATEVVYIGSSTSAGCLEVMPVLNDLTSEYNLYAYYIDADELTDDELNTLLATVPNDLSYDDSGNTVLEVPVVLFIKDGEVILSHVGTVSGHNPEERTMSDEEYASLKQILDYGFSLIQS